MQLYEAQYLNTRINLDKGNYYYCELLGSDIRFMLVECDDRVKAV